MRCVLLHYGELGLKGRNRPAFIRRLAENVRRATEGTGVRKVVRLEGRLLAKLDESAAWDEVHERLSHVFGLANFALAHRTPPDLAQLKDRIAKEIEGRPFASFRISARRAFKTFPLTSADINRELGAFVQQRTGARVDLERPDLTIFVEVLPQEALFYCEKLRGPGGLPVGMSGRVACLISGGIDSPVAAYRMMKRGCEAVFVHFHSFPFLDASTREKTKELVRILTRHQFASRLYLIPFGEIQREVVVGAPAPLRVILYRRLMARIAETLAGRHGARALVTGESLGQVASQTLENLTVIEEAAGVPVLRPLIGTDKEEIVAEARAIGTYEISTIPDEDCCQLFVPRHPAVQTTLDEVRRAEAALDIPGLVARGLDGAEALDFQFPARESASGTPGSGRA